jgi:putative addiction module component (TIGR02574 family)
MQTNDENLLNDVQAMLEYRADVMLTQEQKDELDRRALRHERGESASYTWDEVKKAARAGR